MYNIDDHIKQLKRTIGETHISGNKLEAIYSYDDLKNYYVRTLADLPYGLYVEPRRDRIVMNKQEFEKTLDSACAEGLNNLQKDIYKWINDNVMDEIQTETMFLLNSIRCDNGVFTSKKPPMSDMAKKLGTVFGKALAKNIMSVIDDMTGTKRKKKKR